MSKAIDGPRAEPSGGAPPKQIIILLHGYGMNGQALLNFVPYWRPAFPDALFIAPNAPEPLPSAPGSFRWWALDDYRGRAQAAWADRVAKSLQSLIDTERMEFGIPASQVALVGFSQGATLALHMGPRQPDRIGAVVSYAGMLADPARLAHDLQSRPSVLLVHGDRDTLIPVGAYRAAKDTLEELGFIVEGHVAKGVGHTIDDDGLNRGYQFLTRAFALTGIASADRDKGGGIVEGRGGRDST